MNLKGRRTDLLFGTFYLLFTSAVILLSAGAQEFFRRPVGCLFFVIWWVWWIVMTVLRPLGVQSAVNELHRAPVALINGLVMAAIIIAAPYEYTHFSAPIPRDGWSAYLGLGLFAASILLQGAAMAQMHGLYTTRLGIQPDHKLVTGGLYHIVRHPGYTSNILTLFAISLSLSSLAAFAAALISTGEIVYRIRDEEDMLRGAFGAEFDAYCRATPYKLLPKIF